MTAASGPRGTVSPQPRGLLSIRRPRVGARTERPADCARDPPGRRPRAGSGETEGTRTVSPRPRLRAQSAAAGPAAGGRVRASGGGGGGGCGRHPRGRPRPAAPRPKLQGRGDAGAQLGARRAAQHVLGVREARATRRSRAQVRGGRRGARGPRASPRGSGPLLGRKEQARGLHLQLCGPSSRGTRAGLRAAASRGLEALPSGPPARGPGLAAVAARPGR